jgi:Cu(I)/Ag(I) efflux system membrane fusion protein
LVTTQQEYLLALQSRKSLQNAPFQDIRQGALNLAKTARERLELFDVPDHQIRELEQTGSVLRNLHIHSPTAGIVMNVGVRPGQFVNAQTELYTIADLSQVWVYADIYEYELPWVQVGDKAEMQVQAAPGQTFEGRITYIYPYMDSKTRTIKVRLEFDNPDLVLKPDMYANVSIQADEQLDAVVVPSEAIIRSGTREQVFVQTGPGKFEPREVELGVSSGDMTQILAGVEVDEIVVTSSQFLIDSESKLREAAAKMREVDDDTHQQQGSETSASDSAMEGGGHNHAPSPASETSPGEHKSMEGGGQHDMHSPASETPASDSTMEGGGHNHGQPTGSEEMMEGQHD